MDMRHATLSLAFLIVSLSSAFAQDDSGCDKFAWRLARERVWFAQSDKIVVKAGDKLDTIPERAFVITLQPGDAASFVMPPERKPKRPNAFGGAISFGAVTRPGLYQVTLSDDAWVDLIQDGHYLRSAGSSGRRDCPGLQKSVRLELAVGALILQLSDVEQQTVAVAIGPVE